MCAQVKVQREPLAPALKCALETREKENRVKAIVCLNLAHRQTDTIQQQQQQLFEMTTERFAYTVPALKQSHVHMSVYTSLKRKK